MFFYLWVTLPEIDILYLIYISPLILDYVNKVISLSLSLIVIVTVIT